MRTNRSVVRALAVSTALLVSLAVPAAAVPGVESWDERAPRSTASPQPAPTEDKPVVEAPPRPREDLPAGFASWEALFDEQERLNGIADRIVAAGGEGYAGLVVDPTNHDVRLYWNGAVPAAVNAAVETGRLQAPVQVFPAPYTDARLRAEAQRWMDSGLATDAYPKADGSGLVVAVAGPPAAGSPTLPGGTTIPFTVRHNRAPDVPLVAPAGSIPDATAADAAAPAAGPVYRWNDVSPYWGGALVTVTGGGHCSTGFPVVDSGGFASMLIARHCGPLGNHVSTFTGGFQSPPATFGQLWWTNASHDIGLIWVYSGNVAGRVYTGPWNSDYGRAVQEAGPNYTGNYVCTNGAMSGEHCAIKVFYVSPSDVTVRAERTKSGACAAVHGDSGGPVIAEAGGAIRGKGIISTGTGSVTCWVGGSAMSGYHEIKYKSLTFVLGYFGATLKTW